MITSCGTLTVEKVKAELAVLEGQFKSIKKDLNKRYRAAVTLYGYGTLESGREQIKLTDTTDEYRCHARKLRALLAVLKEEAERPAAAPEPTEEEPKP